MPRQTAAAVLTNCKSDYHRTSSVETIVKDKRQSLSMCTTVHDGSEAVKPDSIGRGWQNIDLWSLQIYYM